MKPFQASIPLLLCLADTGLRLGEALALKWGDLDWRSGVMLVTWSYSHGHLDVTKGGKARKAEMPTRLRATLRAVYEALQVKRREGVPQVMQPTKP